MKGGVGVRGSAEGGSDVFVWDVRVRERSGDVGARAAARWVMRAGVCAAVLSTCPPLRLSAQTSLTIYNDGRVLVRRTFPVQVPKGESTHRLTPGVLEPGSLLPLDTSITLLEARYDSVVGEQNSLRRAVGRKFTFQSQSYPPVPITATLVGMDPERWRLDDGTVLFQRPGLIRWPEDVLFEPTLELRLRSPQARPALGLAYFTAGAHWRAGYQVVLGGSSARVKGVAVITSRTLRADSAELQLLAGTIAPPQPRPGAFDANENLRAMAAAKAAPAEERIEEAHLYTLPGRWSLRQGGTSSLPLFDDASAAVTREYVVRHEPVFGIFQERGEPEEVPVQLTYTLARPRKSAFGDTPLPRGTAQLFRRDAEKRLQLVGEASLDHTPAGKDLVLRAGEAFDLTARRRQTDFRTERDSSAAGVRTRAEAAYEVALTNATDSAATITVQEARAGEWSVLSSSVPAEKVSATLVQFRVPVPARGQATLTYRIRAVW